MQMRGVEAELARAGELRQLLRRNARNEMICPGAGVDEHLISDRFDEIEREPCAWSDTDVLRADTENHRTLPRHSREPNCQRIGDEAPILDTSFQKIHGRAADESRDEPIRRFAIQIERRVHLLNLSRI